MSSTKTNNANPVGGRAVLRAAIATIILANVAVIAHAQMSAPAPAPSPAVTDDTFTFHGITLYGIVDIGLQYENHGAPFGEYHPASSENIVNKNGRQSVTGATSSNLSQSRIGLQGVEPLFVGDLKGVFKVETFFNPSTGVISDALKDQTRNNGRAAASQTTDIDSSVAGQAFQTAYAGVSSKMFGALTFGRQVTLLGDGFGKYDPNYGSQSFSLIGMSGTYAGGGDTEDKRVNSSLKYLVSIVDIAHVGLMYKFNDSNGSTNTLYQVDVGADYAGASFDAYYAKANDAITTSSLSAAQVTTLPTQGSTLGLPVNYFSVGNSLAATVSDNSTLSLMGLYKFEQFKFFAGFEHVQYANPNHPLSAAPLNGIGFDDIGGYKLAYVNNAAFPHEKLLNVAWAGVRYSPLPGLDVVGAVYYYHQNSYGTAAANATCAAGTVPTIAGTCSGHFEAFALDAVYAFSKRFDGYAGAMYSAVYDGVASGYAFERNNINPTVGVRFKF